MTRFGDNPVGVLEMELNYYHLVTFKTNLHTKFGETVCEGNFQFKIRGLQFYIFYLHTQNNGKVKVYL